MNIVAFPLFRDKNERIVYHKIEGRFARIQNRKKNTSMSASEPKHQPDIISKYVKIAEKKHVLHDNPYRNDPGWFTQIRQRIEDICKYIDSVEEPFVKSPTMEQPESSSKNIIDNRELDELFTTLIMIQHGNRRQHYVFRDYFYTDTKETPYLGRYHKHDFIEVFYVIEGTFEQVLLGQNRIFHAGDVVITDKNCEHADLITERPGSVLFLWIQSGFLDQILHYYDGTDNLYRFLFHALREQRSEQQYLHLTPRAEIPEVDYVLEQLMYENYKRGPGYQEVIKWNLLRLFHLLCEQYTLQLYRSGQESKERILLYELERYIGMNLADVTIQDLESRFHYHRNYYNLLLKKYVNMNFRDYVQSLRMDQAAELLKSTDLTVKQIAEQVGYENTSFFYELFERIIHRKPLEYRNIHRR